jgi:hypothetical protein
MGRLERVEDGAGGRQQEGVSSRATAGGPRAASGGPRALEGSREGGAGGPRVSARGLRQATRGLEGVSWRAGAGGRRSTRHVAHGEVGGSQLEGGFWMA